MQGLQRGNQTVSKLHSTVVVLLLCVGSISCNPEVTLFNQNFLNFVSGGQVPIAPGPDAGYVMALVINSTDQSIEWVVTAEAEEIFVRLDRNGGVVSFDPPRTLEPRTVELLTDVMHRPWRLCSTTRPRIFQPWVREQ